MGKPNQDLASGRPGHRLDGSADNTEEQPMKTPRESGKKLWRFKYKKELAKLQVELVKLQEWIKARGLRVVVIFEGRDAAGKGGVIKRITESLNPRICRVVALGTPTDKEKNPVVFPALCAASARRRRNGPV